MVEWQVECEEPDEIAEEYLEEVEEDPEEVPEKITLEEMGFEREEWLEALEKIENREIQEKEIERAKEIIEEEKELEFQRETGEISESRYDHEKLVVLGHKKAGFSMRCDLEADGLSFDKLFDLEEDVDNLHEEIGGDEGPSKLKEMTKLFIRLRGPEYAQEWADENLEEDKITKKIHESISRQVRLAQE